MKQKHLPEVWYLDVDDKVEINGEKFRVSGLIGNLEHCGDDAIFDEKWFVLDGSEREYALVVNENSVVFSELKRPNKNSIQISDKKIKIDSIKIL